MNRFEIGFGSRKIETLGGEGIAGYYVPRYVRGHIDDILTQAIALRCEDSIILMISIDTLGVKSEFVRSVSERIESAVGIPRDRIYISATHTHTSPLVYETAMFESDPQKTEYYRERLIEKTVEAASLAVQDMSSARMGYAVGTAPDRVAYIRRYRMKDGSTMTCPPIDDPNIEEPIGELDRRVNVIRFTREGKPDVVILNFGLHADTIGGELVSADWPGWTRKTVSLALDGAECMFFPGAEGDVGSTNVHPSPSDMNDTEISFDNEMKSPGMARFVGRALAGVILQVYDKVEFSDVNSISFAKRKISVPSNRPAPEDLPRAKEYKRLHDEGRDDLIPYTAMELTTVVAEAVRMCELENGPDSFTIELTGVRIGNIAFVGIPGEPFTDIGVRIKAQEGYDMILPTALTNGDAGYFPVSSAFDEGGYEARSSRYTKGIDDLIVKGAEELLRSLK